MAARRARKGSTVGEAVSQMVQAVEDRAREARQDRADTPSPAKAAMVMQEKARVLPADHPFA
jgi:hypothetical protein